MKTQQVRTISICTSLFLSLSGAIFASACDGSSEPVDGAGGAGGDGAAGGAPSEPACEDAETLPELVDSDLTVGPGCVRLNRTSISEDATLTIQPGTRVLVEPGGFLNVGVYGDASALVAKGTAADPIVFTSSADNPAPGDWQCIRIETGSAATEISHVAIEYGGSACDADGAGILGSLQIKSPARVDHLRVSQSSSHGVYLMADGAVRRFEDVTFADNEAEGLKVSAKQLTQLGTGLVFEDSDDRILIDNTFALGTSGTVLAQPVPFLTRGGLDIDNDAAVVFAAGLQLELDGGSVHVFAADLDVAGTAEKPVLFTSAASSKESGDWGCLYYDAPNGNPSLTYAIFEYGGSGQGCSGAEYTALLSVPATAELSNLEFRESAGDSIIWPCGDNPIPSGFCDHSFTNAGDPVSCTFGGPVSCP